MSMEQRYMTKNEDGNILAMLVAHVKYHLDMLISDACM